jgi:hypothetical protein
MKHFTNLLSLIVVLFLFNCKGDSEVLAKFEGGEIKRKDLRNLYTVQFSEDDEKTKTTEVQSNIIEQLAVYALYELEAEKDKHFDKQEVKNLISLSEHQILTKIYQKKILEDLKNSEKLDLVNIQFLLKNIQDESSIEPLYQSLLQLKSKEEIDAFVSNQTEELGRKSISGYLEPVCMNCIGQEHLIELFKEGINSEEKKFYLYKQGNQAFIYRVVGRNKISPLKLEDHMKAVFKNFQEKAQIYTNASTSQDEKEYASYYLETGDQLNYKAKGISNEFVNQFERNLWIEELKKLKSNPEVTIAEELKMDPNSIISPLPKDLVLLKSKSSTFTFKDLEDEFSKIPNPTNSPSSDLDKLSLFHNILFDSLLIKETKKFKSVLESDEYQFSLKLLKQSIASTHLREKISKNIGDITEDEIKATYEAGKMFTYSKAKSENSQERIPIPYNEIKDKVRKDILTQKSNLENKNFVKELKEKYKLELFTDKLEAGKI